MSLLGPEGALSRMNSLQQRISAYSGTNSNKPTTLSSSAVSYKDHMDLAMKGPLKPFSPGGNFTVDANVKGLQEMARNAANEAGVDPELFLALVEKESSWNPNSVNRKSGATGLSQLMPETARGLGVKNALDPEENLRGGAKYLKKMLDAYQGNEKLALAAYNAGPGNVNKAGGIPDFPETIAYVSGVLRIKERGFGNR